MTIFEVLQELTRNKDKYVGFKCESEGGFYLSSDYTIRRVNDDIKRTIVDVIINWAHINDWILIEKEVIPEGYYKNVNGNIIKPCKYVSWVNVFEDIETRKVIYRTYATKNEADQAYSCHNTHRFVKQLHVAQQFSIPYVK